MGGMQALPGPLTIPQGPPAIPIATSPPLRAEHRVYEVGRHAIISDPASWGDYGTEGPRRGLAMADDGTHLHVRKVTALRRLQDQDPIRNGKPIR